MPPLSIPKARMIAGPNGSGKSTLFRHLRTNFSFPLGYCLNPDEIDRELVEAGRIYLGAWGLQLDDAGLRSYVRSHGLGKRVSGSLPTLRGNALFARHHYRPGYFASVFADLLRREWMTHGESFTFETVMSHQTRVTMLGAAQRRGYRTYLYYICTDDPVISAARIANRVSQGGHDVPRPLVEDRYRRSLALLPRAIRLSSRAYLFDNSGTAPRFIAEYDTGKLVRIAEDLPRWFVSSVLDRGGRRKRSR